MGFKFSKRRFLLTKSSPVCRGGSRIIQNSRESSLFYYLLINILFILLLSFVNIVIIICTGRKYVHWVLMPDYPAIWWLIMDTKQPTNRQLSKEAFSPMSAPRLHEKLGGCSGNRNRRIASRHVRIKLLHTFLQIWLTAWLILIAFQPVWDFFLCRTIMKLHTLYVYAFLSSFLGFCFLLGFFFFVYFESLLYIKYLVGFFV